MRTRASLICLALATLPLLTGCATTSDAPAETSGRTVETTSESEATSPKTADNAVNPESSAGAAQGQSAASTSRLPTVSAPTPSVEQSADKPGSFYAVPEASNPQGQIEIKSLGVTELRTAESSQSLPVIHLKMIVRNETGDLDWSVDARLQQAQLDRSTFLRPAFARAKGASLPFISIARGETKEIDLYYVVPPDRRAPGSIQSFTLDWQLIAGERMLSQTTDFGSQGVAGGSVNLGSSRAPTSPAPPNEGSTSTPSGESTSGTSLEPSADPRSTSPPVGVESDWWQDPFADLPFPWRDVVN